MNRILRCFPIILFVLSICCTNDPRPKQIVWSDTKPEYRFLDSLLRKSFVEGKGPFRGKYPASKLKIDTVFFSIDSAKALVITAQRDRISDVLNTIKKYNVNEYEKQKKYYKNYQFLYEFRVLFYENTKDTQGPCFKWLHYLNISSELNYKVATNELINFYKKLRLTTNNAECNLGEACFWNNSFMINCP